MGVRKTTPPNARDYQADQRGLNTRSVEILRRTARRTTNVRLLQLGISRRELAEVLGCSKSHLNNVIGGSANSVPTRRLLEIALGVPIWSTPEEFNSLTKYLSRSPQQFPQTTQTEKTEK